MWVKFWVELKLKMNIENGKDRYKNDRLNQSPVL